MFDKMHHLTLDANGYDETRNTTLIVHARQHKPRGRKRGR